MLNLFSREGFIFDSSRKNLMFENWIYVENLQVAKNKIVSATSN